MSPAVKLELTRTGVGTVRLHDYNPTAGGAFLSGPVPMGYPEVIASWAEGAGDGSRWLGSRAASRDLPVPVYLTGTREQIAEQLLLISLILGDGDPAVAEDRAQLRWVEQDTGTVWWVRVVRTGTEGWATDHRTWARMVLNLRTEDPFATREQPEKVTVTASGEPVGLLTGSLSELRLAPSQAMGTRTVTNPGDRPAPPRWEITGPGTGLTLVSPTGEVLQWDGTLATGETLVIDTRTGVVVDSAGTNRYGDLAPAPRFWHVPPGSSTIDITLTGATSASKVVGLWWPRRSFVF